MTGLPRQLGDGLVLRHATLADVDELAAFNQRIHIADGIDQWTRDLMERPHPTLRLEDFTVVEDVASGAIVSSLNVIPQTWRYRGIPFGVGRIELVGTEPAYRRRGLVRTQMDVVHSWCEERGLLVQGITGVPNYYRRFGYEMALEMIGARHGPSVGVPTLEDGASEPFSFRPATDDDAAFLSEVHARVAERCVVSDPWDEDFWRYTISGRTEGSNTRYPVEVILDGDERVGLVAWWNQLTNRGAVPVILYELVEDAAWTLVTPSMLRRTVEVGKEMAEKKGRVLGDVALSLGSEHPVYDVLTRFLHPPRRAYAWYVRVADLVGFLRHVSPALEWSLADSAAAAHTGELKVSFYEDGVRLVFEQGLIAAIEPFVPEDVEDGDVQFPGLTFLHLLFGHRTLEELEHAHVDCYASSDTAAALLNGLFPPGASFVGGVE